MRSVDNRGLYMYILHYGILAQTLSRPIRVAPCTSTVAEYRIETCEQFYNKTERGSREIRLRSNHNV